MYTGGTQGYDEGNIKMWGDERKEEEEWDADGARWRVGIRRAEKADVCATLAADRVGGDGIILYGGKPAASGAHESKFAAEL